MSPSAKFIAFEGGEGAGKSTLIRLLTAHLQSQGIAAVITREPGGTDQGKQLRQLLLTGDPGTWDPMAETLLMVADRAQHIAQIIKPALKAGQHVITDRYAFSTLAYQGGARGVSVDFLKSLHNSACGDLWPDMTIVLDLDPKVGLARSGRRLTADASAENRFEQFGLDFHERVRKTFLDLAAADRVKTRLVNAERPVEAVWAEVKSVLAPLLT